jgi:hypothetical protein
MATEEKKTAPTEQVPEHEECKCMAEVLQLARDHRQLLIDHRKDFADHRADAKLAMAKIDVIHTQSTAMEKHAENLNSLPGIYDVLKGIREDLIAPATGRKQMPVSIAMTVIILLGALLLLDRVRDSNKEVVLSPTEGIKITTGEKPEQKKIQAPVQ